MDDLSPSLFDPAELYRGGVVYLQRKNTGRGYLPGRNVLTHHCIESLLFAAVHSVTFAVNIYIGGPPLSSFFLTAT